MRSSDLHHNLNSGRSCQHLGLGKRNMSLNAVLSVPVLLLEETAVQCTVVSLTTGTRWSLLTGISPATWQHTGLQQQSCSRIQYNVHTNIQSLNFRHISVHRMLRVLLLLLLLLCQDFPHPPPTTSWWPCLLHAFSVHAPCRSVHAKCTLEPFCPPYQEHNARSWKVPLFLLFFISGYQVLVPGPWISCEPGYGNLSLTPGLHLIQGPGTGTCAFLLKKAGY